MGCGRFRPVRSLVAKVSADLGPVDVAVDNVGVMHDGTMRRMDRLSWDHVLEKIVARIPVGRLGKANEAGFVIGSTMSINGGQHMY